MRYFTLFCGVLVVGLVVHEWYGVTYGFDEEQALWVANADVQRVETPHAGWTAVPAPGKNLLVLKKHHEESGWLIHNCDAWHNERVILRLAELKPGLTVSNFSDGQVLHCVFVPIGGPTRIKTNVSAHGSFHLVKIKDDSIRLAYNITIHAYDWLRADQHYQGQQWFRLSDTTNIPLLAYADTNVTSAAQTSGH